MNREEVRERILRLVMDRASVSASIDNIIAQTEMLVDYIFAVRV